MTSLSVCGRVWSICLALWCLIEHYPMSFFGRVGVCILYINSVHIVSCSLGFFAFLAFSVFFTYIFSSRILHFSSFFAFSPRLHTHSLTPPHPHTPTPSHPHTLTPSHPHTLTPSLTHAHTPTHPHALTPSLTHTLTPSHTPSLTHTLTGCIGSCGCYS